MKIWSSEHVFDHPWETVAKAAVQKYPNPLNTNVTGIDVVERRIDSLQRIRSHRLIQTTWHVSLWIARLLGGNRTCLGSEHSCIDRAQRRMSLQSRNLTFSNVVSIDERLTYTPHPSEPERKTLLQQEAIITVGQHMPLIDYLESLVFNTINTNAHKGRQAIEFVIERMQQSTTQQQ